MCAQCLSRVPIEYILFHIIFHYGLLQDTEYNSLCYTVGLCVSCLFFFGCAGFLLWHKRSSVFITTWGIFRCNIEMIRCDLWDLAPWPGIEPESPALAVWSLSHWSTREVPGPCGFNKWVFNVVSEVVWKVYGRRRMQLFECKLVWQTFLEVKKVIMEI